MNNIIYTKEKLIEYTKTLIFSQKITWAGSIRSLSQHDINMINKYHIEPLTYAVRKRKAKIFLNELNEEFSEIDYEYIDFSRTFKTAKIFCRTLDDLKILINVVITLGYGLYEPCINLTQGYLLKIYF
jgi:hypothetical protein